MARTVPLNVAVVLGVGLTAAAEAGVHRGKDRGGAYHTSARTALYPLKVMYRTMHMEPTVTHRSALGENSNG